MPRHAIGRLFRLIQDPFGTFGELFLSHPYRNSKAPPRKFLTKDKGFIRVKVAYKFWRHAWYYLQFVGAKQVAKRIESNIFFLNAEVAKGIVVWKEFMALTKTCITEHHAVPLQMRFSFFFPFFHRFIISITITSAQNWTYLPEPRLRQYLYIQNHVFTINFQWKIFFKSKLCGPNSIGLFEQNMGMIIWGLLIYLDKQIHTWWHHDIAGQTGIQNKRENMTTQNDSKCTIFGNKSKTWNTMTSPGMHQTCWGTTRYGWLK